MKIQNISFLIHKGLLIMFKTRSSTFYRELQAMFNPLKRAFFHKELNFPPYTAQFKTPPQVVIGLILPPPVLMFITKLMFTSLYPN